MAKKKKSEPSKQKARTMCFRLSGAAADMGVGDALDELAAEVGMSQADCLRNVMLAGFARVKRDRGALLTAAKEAQEALAA